MGNGLWPPLRWPFIRATLRTPAGLSKIGGVSDAVALLAAARHSHHTMSIWIGRNCNEGHRRTRATAEITEPRPPRGGAPQHHPDPGQRAGARRECAAVAEGHRPRS